MEEQKVNKLNRQLYNEAAGRNIDADFDILIEQSRLHPNEARPQALNNSMKI